MAESPYARMTREELAEIEVGKTAINRATSIVMVAGFILTIVGVPFVQHVIEIRGGFLKSGSWVWPKAYEIFNYPRRAWRELIDPANGSFLNRLQAANGQLPLSPGRRSLMRRHLLPSFSVLATSRFTSGGTVGYSTNPTLPMSPVRDF